MLELPVVGVQAEFLNLEDQGDEVHDGKVGDDDKPPRASWMSSG